MNKPLSFVILSSGLGTFKELRTALANDSRTRLLAGGDDVEQVYPEIRRLKCNAVIVVMETAPQSALALIEKLKSESPDVAIITAARETSPDLILASMRAGAQEFLRLPIIASEFDTVIERTIQNADKRTPTAKPKGKLIAVFSSKGGCGTTFVAANIAAAIGESTCLVDLNLQAGDLPLFLGIEPRYSIADVVENRTRMDDALLTSYVAPYSNSLSLLAAPREADAADEIEPEHVFNAIERLREKYQYVVLDPQHTFDSITLAALDQADEIVLVLTLDIPAIRSAQRSLEIFDRLGYSRRKINVVVNRFSKQIDLDLTQVEKFLGESVTGYISSDYQTAVTSINLGQPLVLSQPSSRIATEIRRITAGLTGGHGLSVAGEAEKKGFWNSIFKRDQAAASFPANPGLSEDLRPSLTR